MYRHVPVHALSPPYSTTYPSCDMCVLCVRACRCTCVKHSCTRSSYSKYACVTCRNITFIILDRLEGAAAAQEQALRLMRSSLLRGQYPLCCELLRFVVPPSDQDADNGRLMSPGDSGMQSCALGVSRTYLFYTIPILCLYYTYTIPILMRMLPCRTLVAGGRNEHS